MKVDLKQKDLIAMLMGMPLKGVDSCKELAAQGYMIQTGIFIKTYRWNMDRLKNCDQLTLHTLYRKYSG